MRGTVQGVGFRWFVREHAQALGLCGWVRNRSDGSVEVLARGEASQVEQFKALVSRGPRGAAVEATVDLNDEGTVGDAFEIIR